MLTTTIALAATLLGAAHAGPSELTFDVGSFASPDHNWQMFGPNEAVTTWGFRYGHSLGGNLSLLVGWQHARHGGRIYFDSDEDDWDWDSGASFHTKFVTNQFALGPKYHYDLAPWVAPYATAQVVGWHGRMLIDDDIDEDDNPNQVSYGAFAPGGVAALGVDVKPIRVGGDTRIATHLEMGYGYTLKLKFHDKNGEEGGSGDPVNVGELAFKGLYVHWGMGLRF